MGFFKTFFASLLAFVVAGALVAIFCVMIFAGALAGLTGGGHAPAAVRGNSVLVIDLAGGISDSPATNPVGMTALGGLEISHANTILETVKAIETASWDRNIKGLLIDVEGGGDISTANIEELRRAVMQFREESGKFVIGYADSYSQWGYYLASAADYVFLNPQGALAWQGLASQVIFYKGLFDKLGIRAEIVRHGSYKAAVEPFMLTAMSPENREQLNAVLGSVWAMMLDDISESRGISAELLSQHASELRVNSADDCYRLGFVDGLAYEDQVLSLVNMLAGGDDDLDDVVGEWSLRHSIWAPTVTSIAHDPMTARERTELEEGLVETLPADVTAVEQIEERPLDATGEPHRVSLADYITSLRARGSAVRTRNRIAVVYIDGELVGGVSEGGVVGSASVADKLRRAMRDDNVKGVVVRVNSPGGSALAAEVMWREIEQLRLAKPVVVSMGGYAASGGYYVSCPADAILADRSTLTGSIGVFGLLLDVGDALRDNLGVTVDVARTNAHADLGSPFRPLQSAERDYMQRSVEQVYGTFVARVAAGRNLSPAEVDEVGGGRVWSGAMALEIGLVDGFGGLVDAIELAADRAGVAGDYRVVEAVDDQDVLSRLITSLSSGTEQASQGPLGTMRAQYEAIAAMIEQQGVQARMPYILDVR